MKTMVINAIHVTAVTATGIEKRPKWKGPLLKSCLFRTRNKIGIPSVQFKIGLYTTVIIETYIPYDMYNPMVAIDVAAAKATELPRLGRPSMKLRVHASQTCLCHE